MNVQDQTDSDGGKSDIHFHSDTLTDIRSVSNTIQSTLVLLKMKAPSLSPRKQNLQSRSRGPIGSESQQRYRIIRTVKVNNSDEVNRFNRTIKTKGDEGSIDIGSRIET